MIKLENKIKIPAKDKKEIPFYYSNNANSRIQSSSTYIEFIYKMIHIYTTGKTINQLAIGYIINPSLQFNNTFITQVEKFLGVSFSIGTMKTIKNIMMKKNTCVMALIMIYENNGENKNCIEC